VLNEHTHRTALLETLLADLSQAVEQEVPSTQEVVRHVILTPEQQKLLSKYWRSMGRSIDWAHEAGRSLLARVPLIGFAAKNRSHEPEEATGDAASSDHYVAEARRLETRLHNIARRSRFWREAGTPDKPILPEAGEPNALRAAGEAHRQACRDAVADLEARIKDEAVKLRVNVRGAGIGAVVGLLIGGVLAMPTGGLSVPAGAVLGSLIAGSATGISARVWVRLYNAVRGTPESRQLMDTVRDYRAGLHEHAESTVTRLAKVCRGRTLAGEPELHNALKILQSAPFPREPGRSQVPPAE
jgi:hypothetical protein